MQKELLERLRSSYNLSWQQIQQLLLDPERNNWRLAFKYGLSPYLCNIVKEQTSFPAPAKELLEHCSLRAEQEQKKEGLECDITNERKAGRYIHRPLESSKNEMLEKVA